MKKKHLKKILAIMLASMTVSSTPGLVGAMKEESKKAIQDVNSQITNHTLTEEAATNMLDELEEMAKEDDEAKAEVAKTIKNGFLNYLFRRESRDKIINILHTCSQSKGGQTRSDIAVAIGSILSHYTWELHPGEDELFAKILNVLEICTQEPAAMPEATKAISQMGRGQFYKFGDDSRSKILYILDVCARNSAASRSNVASAIRTMFDIDSQSIISFMNESLDRIINILEVCAQEPTAIGDVMSTVRYMEGHHTVGHNLTNIVHRMLSILDTCSKKDDVAKNEAALAISWLYWMVNEESIDETLITTLKEFSENIDPAVHISEMIRRMGELGTLNTCDPQKTRQIIDIFLSCPRSYDNYSLSFDAKYLIAHGVLGRCRPDQIQKLFAELIKNLKNHGDGIYPVNNQVAAEAINEMIKKDLLGDINIDTIISFAKESSCWDDINNAISIIKTVMENDNIMRRSPDRIPKTVDALAKILEGNFGPEYKAISIVTTMNNRDMLNQCDDSQIQRIFDSLIRFLRSDYYIGGQAADAILAMNERGLLNKCTPVQIRQIVGNLTRLLENNNTRKRAITIIAAITRNNNVLDQLDPADIQRLANSLPGDLANNNTQEAATIIISAMAENPQTFNQFNHDQLSEILRLFGTYVENYLAGGNYEMVDRIFEVFKRCSEIDALKADVTDIAKMLTTDEFLSPYLGQEIAKPRLRNLIDTLHSCSKTQNDETKEKVAFIIANVMWDFSLGKLPSRYLPDQISQRVSEIIDILKECSRANIYKFDVASSIQFLAKEGFFNSLIYSQSSNLIDTLDNCLTYKGARIRDNMQNNKINDAQLNILLETNVAIGELWKSAFRAGLLPGEQPSRFDQISQECKELASNLPSY